MSEIQRYNVLRHDLLEVSGVGSLTSSEVLVVLASDHEREIAALRARLDEARKLLDDCASACERSYDASDWPGPGGGSRQEKAATAARTWLSKENSGG